MHVCLVFKCTHVDTCTWINKHFSFQILFLTPPPFKNFWIRACIPFPLLYTILYGNQFLALFLINFHSELCLNSRMSFCLLFCFSPTFSSPAFSSHSRIIHLYGDVTIQSPGTVLNLSLFLEVLLPYVQGIIDTIIQ